MWTAIAAGVQIALLVLKKLITWDDAKRERINKTIQTVRKAGADGDQQALEDAINSSNAD